MRVASNKLKHLLDYYHSELKDLYPVSEITSLYTHAVHHYLGIPFAEIKFKGDEQINQSDLLNIYDCAKALAKHVPLQYILGETVFYNQKIKVNKHVLIPRPETEELVDMVLKENKQAASVLDIGTGSGCIGIALKKHLPEAEVWACDVSPLALELASANAQQNNTGVHFFECDVLSPFTNTTTYDIIISNPPYIKESEKEQMLKNVTEHEPHLALFVYSADATLFYKKITDICKASLKPGGRLYFELNPLTAGEVLNYTMDSGLFKSSELINDMSGNTRFLKAVKN